MKEASGILNTLLSNDYVSIISSVFSYHLFLTLLKNVELL